MIINLNKEYRIHSDEHQWTLEQMHIIKKGKSKGEEYWSAVGHYNTLEGTLHGLIERHIRFSEVEAPSYALEALLASLSEFREEISRNISAWLKASARGLAIIRK